MNMARWVGHNDIFVYKIIDMIATVEYLTELFWECNKE